MTVSGNDEGNLTESLDALCMLDFSTAVDGPHGIRMRADLCAEVIEIESADGGTMRSYRQSATAR